MRFLGIAVGLCVSACSLVWASYTYYFTDTLTTVNTTKSFDAKTIAEQRRTSGGITF